MPITDCPIWLARGGLGPLNFTIELWFLYFTAFIIKRVKPIRSNAYPATTMSPATILSHSTAAVLYGPRDIRITDRLICLPTPDQVQVEILSTGLCGSDRMAPLSLSFFL